MGLLYLIYNNNQSKFDKHKPSILIHASLSNPQVKPSTQNLTSIQIVLSLACTSPLQTSAFTGRAFFLAEFVASLVGYIFVVGMYKLKTILFGLMLNFALMV